MISEGMHNKNENNFGNLIALCERLRSKNGCLWDRKQTHETLLPFLEEETREVAEAIRNNDIENFKEELGDLLFQVIFHSQIAAENGNFNIYDVIDVLIAKLKRRHPHVFGKTRVDSVEEIVSNWKKIKKKEKDS